MTNIGGVDANVTLFYENVDGIQFATGSADLHIKDLGQSGGDLKIKAYHIELPHISPLSFLYSTLLFFFFCSCTRRTNPQQNV
jgi:hypothetical protein